MTVKTRFMVDFYYNKCCTFLEWGSQDRAYWEHHLIIRQLRGVAAFSFYVPLGSFLTCF